jgi:TrmH family RNA methyltransferase
MTTLLLPQPRIKTWDDARLHTICALGKRAERDRTQTFFTEGLRFVGQAVAQEAEIEAVLVVPKTLEHSFGLKLRRQLEEKRVPIWEITPELFQRLSRAEEPQWIGAVIRQRWAAPTTATSSPGLCWVALDQVHSPGNLGTILRTSEAVGASGLIALGDSVDPYDPGCVRATMGAVFAQQFVRMAPAEFAAWKQHTGVYLVGTSPHAKRDYRAVAYPPGTVLLMGGERKGLSSERQGLCDELVRIPMVGQADSLNLAVATGVMLYEVFYQRCNPG